MGETHRTLSTGAPERRATYRWSLAEARRHIDECKLCAGLVRVQLEHDAELARQRARPGRRT